MGRSTFTSTLRLGNTLDVITGTVDPTAGGGVAAAIGSLYMRATTGQLWEKGGAGNTAWVQVLLTLDTSGNSAAWYGTGADGVMHFDGVSTVTGLAGLSLAPVAGVYTLTRDIFATTMTIDAGVVIIVAGFRVFAQVTLTNNGAIRANGGNGGNATTVAVGAAGTAPVAGSISGGSAGAAGGAATAAGGNSASPAASHLGAATTNNTGPAAPGNGSNGGTLQGGAGGGGTAGGGNGGTAVGLTIGSMSNAPHFYAMFQAQQGRNAANTQLNCGDGGGGGGGGAVANQGNGGGGGASGGLVLVSARLIAGSGSFEAKGGNGGTGSVGTGGGGAGGGGGGAGGVIVVFSESKYALSVTLSVTGGTGGAPAGAAGTGGNGGSGLTYLFNPTGFAE